MTMKKTISISLIITIFKSVLLVPYKVTGGMEGVNKIEYLTIFKLFNKPKNINDAFNYSLIIPRYIIETIIVFTLCLIILNIINKKTNKRRNK